MVKKNKSAGKKNKNMPTKVKRNTPKVTTVTVVSPELLTQVHNSIITIRDKAVITDADLANLYGVETKRINEAVRNNPDKFPEDYMFSLSIRDLQYLRSKISTANISMKSRVPPKVFTEKGLYMLATVLKSNQALNVTFAIIETFAKVRNLKHALVDFHQETDPQLQNAKMQHFGEMLSDIVMPDLETTETESSLELNFFIGKIKHTVKRIKKSDGGAIPC